MTPPQVLRVNKFGDSGIEIRILGDCKSLQQWALMGELRLRLKKAFDQEGIEIPWPHIKILGSRRLSGWLPARLVCRLTYQTINSAPSAGPAWVHHKPACLMPL
ncbi:hypothetical protein ACFLWO_00980 [Chloroflexota bacterium]